MCARTGSESQHALAFAVDIAVDVLYKVFGDELRSIVGSLEDAGVDLFLAGEGGCFDFILRAVIPAWDAVELNLRA